MAKLGKAMKWRKLERPYTRISKYREHSFIRGNPPISISKFDMGDKEEKFNKRVDLKVKVGLQIRHNAIESARQIAIRILEKKLGSSFHFKVATYPHHILREHALAAVAQADRFTSGMAHPFGKPVGRAARLMKNQPIFTVYVNEGNLDTAKLALDKARFKIPCQCTVIVSENKLVSKK